jgi:hypothetical protein
LTRAACHTNGFETNRPRWPTDDGAPGRVQSFLTDLVRSLKETHDDPAKFDRFKTKLLGGREINNSIAG